MPQRGRKSAASLAVVQLGTPAARPDPPAELTADQARIWRNVVASMPGGWFHPSSEPLLVQFCRHVTAADVLAKAIDAFDPAELGTKEGLARYGQLVVLRERESKALAMFATKLRLTLQSRDARVAGRLVRDQPPTDMPQPWRT